VVPSTAIGGDYSREIIAGWI